MKVVIAGDGSPAIQLFQALAKRNVNAVAVLTSPPQENSAAGGLWKLAKRTGVEPWPSRWVKDPHLAGRLQALEPDLLLNLYSLYMIHDTNLRVPRLGCYNVHPGPLPRYAGLNSMCWAIYNGETQHGVTVHQMVPEVDAGPIAYQELFNIGAQETGLTLSTRCIRVGILLALRLLDTARASGEIPRVPQALAEREYYGKGPPQKERICWEQSAKQIFNFVRACDFAPFPSPWDHPKAIIGDQEIAIVKASLTGRSCNQLPGTVGKVDDAGVEIATRDEWLLLRLVLHNGKSCAASSAIKSSNMQSSRG